MRKIANIARPCGDCWTRIEKESFLYRLMCWTDLMYARTGKRIYERISAAAGKAARIDPDKVLTLAIAFMLGAAVAAVLLAYAAYGQDMGQTAIRAFEAFTGRITGVYRYLVYNQDANGILYVLGLAG